MNPFRKRTARRIAATGIPTAAGASAVAWFVALENAEEGIVSLAMEKSGGLPRHFDAINLNTENSSQHAMAAAKAMPGGMLDIAEICDSKALKLAGEMTPEGEATESSLPHHAVPGYVTSSCESISLSGDHWVLRVFVPLRA